jgi:hypothetical protein
MRATAETLAKALAWVNERLAKEPGLERWKAVDEAARRFDLGPLDTEWLLNQLTPPQRTQ